MKRRLIFPQPTPMALAMAHGRHLEAMGLSAVALPTDRSDRLLDAVLGDRGMVPTCPVNEVPALHRHFADCDWDGLS